MGPQQIRKKRNATVPLAIPVRKILRWKFFLMVRFTSTTGKYTIQMDFLCTSHTFPTISREPALITYEFCTANAGTARDLLMRL